jgi:pimeloyl-ACP methyl ester carboxylesterase
MEKLMQNPRIYGEAPYQIAVIHGGPGALGEMAHVARELATLRGVLEPLQTKITIQGQLEELSTIVREHASLPLILIGHSWGAMLSYLFAAQYPAMIKKLILVSSGVFEEHYALKIMRTCLSRLSTEERIRLDELTRALDDPAKADKNAIFTELGELIGKAYDFDPLPQEKNELESQYEHYQGVWQEAVEMRSSGELLEAGKNILCPVVAIHGDYDPHPAEGVRAPLSRVLKDFRFLLLEHCGHTPWYEREARERFYELLKQEIV